MKIKNKLSLLFLLLLILFFGIPLLAQINNVSFKYFTMNIESNPLKIPIYSNVELTQSNTKVDKAIIVVHGNNRNADDYFDNISIAASSATEFTQNILIVAPQFLTEEDIAAFSLDKEHLYWTSGGWKSGSNSRNEDSNPRPVRIPSYAVMDSLMERIAHQFPNLKSLVFTGHSAGGQVAQRMAATSPMAEILCQEYGISTRFVVANPSSYVYMDNQRRVADSQTQFSIPNTSCSIFNEWKYGLDDLFTYPKAIGIPTIRTINKRNVVTYLLGEADNNPNSSSLDTSCEAKLQGEHRLERGIIYYNYLQHYYGEEITENHQLVTVPNAGHSNFEMYNSPEGVRVLFEQVNSGCSNVVSSHTVSSQKEISVFPNPSKGEIYVELPDPLVGSITYSIYDLKGNLLKSENNLDNNRISISSLKSGMYILGMEIAGQRFLQKLVIQN